MESNRRLKNAAFFLPVFSAVCSAGLGRCRARTRWRMDRTAEEGSRGASNEQQQFQYELVFPSPGSDIMTYLQGGEQPIRGLFAGFSMPVSSLAQFGDLPHNLGSIRTFGQNKSHHHA
jgi:hypothetical protein